MNRCVFTGHYLSYCLVRIVGHKNIYNKEDYMKNEISLKDTSDKTQTQKALLNHTYTFNNFVVGNTNNIAFESAKSVCNNPGVLYNPLIIQGGIGIGKTHLLHAIGNIMQAQGKKVIYTSVEDFLSDFTKHLSNRTLDRFKSKYKQCDVFLLEDIQFLSNKYQTQEEIFNIIETLRAENKQIVITSDTTPKLIV